MLRSVLSDTLKSRDSWLWAAGQNALAVGLQNQGSRTGGVESAALLGQAVAAYRDALTVRTRADHPVDWAMTQNNLGGAYLSLSQHDARDRRVPIWKQRRRISPRLLRFSTWKACRSIIRRTRN